MSRSILIATHSESLRQSVYPELIKEDYQIIETSSGQETLSAMEKLDHLDLLLIDAPLQDMDGIELSRQIKNIPVYRFLPIVILVSKQTKMLETEGLAAGITGWITQPVTPDKLKTVINRLLR